MSQGDTQVEQIFQGIYKVPDPKNPKRKLLATRNGIPGKSLYGEPLVKAYFQSEKVEFRLWDPFRSKLSASILNGLKVMPFGAGSNCLYLGASTGTTVSHISDIFGESGKIFAVEVAPRVAREFLENVVKYRQNVTPIIADARHPERYNSIYGKIPLIYCDIAQPDQTDIAITNCGRFFESGDENFLFLVVKASSIDVVKSKDQVFKEQEDRLRASNFEILQKIDLEPFDKNHAMIISRAKGF